MNKTKLKFFSILVISIIFIYAFSASYTSDSIDNISYVIALAIDLAEDGENLQVTFEFMDTSSFSSEQSSETSKAIIDTVNAKSINSALNLLNAYIGKEVNLSHCKVVVFSDVIASKGIYSEVTELINNIQVRPSTNIIICKGNAMEYIQKSTSELEKILTKYYDIFPNSSEYTGYTSNIMIGEFYNYLTTKECGNLAILGGLNPEITPKDSTSSSNSGSSNGDSSSNSSDKKEEQSTKPKNVPISEIISGNSPFVGERGTEDIGLAVIKDGKYIADLSAADTLCHTLITGEVNSFLLSIDNSDIYEKYIDIALYENTSPHISVDISNDVPNIHINIQLIGRIVGIKNDITYSEEQHTLDLQKISNAVSSDLKQYMTNYLNKTSSEFKCDIDYFYNHAKRNFLTLQDWTNYDWSTKYEKSVFDISIDSRVYYSLLNSD